MDRWTPACALTAAELVYLAPGLSTTVRAVAASMAGPSVAEYAAAFLEGAACLAGSRRDERVLVEEMLRRDAAMFRVKLDDAGMAHLWRLYDAAEPGLAAVYGEAT